MAAAHCRHGWRVLERTRSRRLGNGSRASTFISAWASAEPKISPAGPSLSCTRLRAAWTIVPSWLDATAPTGTFPVRSASHPCRNASRQGSSRSAHTCAAVACLARVKSTKPVWLAFRSCVDVGREVLAGEGGAAGDEVGGRSLEDDPAAVVAGAGAEVDDPVGVRHDRLVVLDDDDRLAGVDEPVEQAEQLLDVGEVQAGGR